MAALEELCSDENAPKNGIPLTRSPRIELLLNTPKGRGIFASCDIPAHTILEVSPVLVLDPQENDQFIRKTNLYNYTYNWPYSPTCLQSQTSPDGRATNEVIQTQAIILGLGSMFNHSRRHQNVGWRRDISKQVVTYSTLREVKAGEELCINYGQRLTFQDVDQEDDYTEDAWQDVLNGGILD